MIINGAALMELEPIKNMVPSKERIHGLSYGLSEVGYDFRIKQEVKFTAPRFGRYLDIIREGIEGIYTDTELEELVMGSVEVIDPYGNSTKQNGRTAIGSSIEEFQIPDHVWAEFRNKSTHARRFLDASLGTDGEPGWRGHLTIEMVFQGNDDYHLPAGCPILKAVFHEITEPRSYRGKYQHQPDEPVPAIFERDQAMKKFFVCYERSFHDWNLVIYHDEPPPKKSANGELPEHTQPIELGPEFIGEDGEPLMGKIAKAYPKPE